MANIKKYGSKKETAKKSERRQKAKIDETLNWGCPSPVEDDCGCTIDACGCEAACMCC